jgi:hypothetical protein
MNLVTKMLDSACSMCYIQNGDWCIKRGSGHVLQIDMVQIVSRPIFQGESESKEGNAKISM